MTDEELIARLRGDMPEMRPNRGWGWREDIDFVAVEEERKKAADRIETLVKERDAAYAYAKHLAEAIFANSQFDAPQWEPLEDTLGVLMQIDNMVAGIRARAERLEARCKALIAAYDKVNWMRTADYHGDLCSCLRCHFDHLRADLKGDDHE